jgi:two-component system cell cycle response regulator
MNMGQPRVILVDVSEASREVLVRRLSAQGYAVEAAADPVTGADLALSEPPAAVVADLWMPGISGIQLCRLLRAEAATADVPVILRGDDDDPRSRFWAERAGAVGYVRKGRMGELVRLLARTVSQSASNDDGFFMQLGGGSIDIRDRIARYLDAALFDSVIAAEVRSLASAGSFDRLFDLFAQFLCQVIGYRWLALAANDPSRLALHCHPAVAEAAEREARAALDFQEGELALRVVDEDAGSDDSGPAPVVCSIPFGSTILGTLALGPTLKSEGDAESLVRLVARELGGPMRIAALMDEQQRLAAIDALTGLRNRRSFSELLNVEYARASRYGSALSFLLLDVDHFKAVNDRHGHPGGDAVLAAVGGLLRTCLRTPDLPARWGGEEFVVALPSTDLEGATVVAERVRQAIQGFAIGHAGATIQITASVGVATLRGGESLDSLIDRADRAMYEAKGGGRNRVVAATEPAARAVPAVPAEAASALT